jgi:hypothetical protein
VIPVVRLAPLVCGAALLTGAVLVSTVVQGAAASAQTPGPAAFSIQWAPQDPDTNKVVVQVHGISPVALRDLEKAPRTPEQWQRLLAVYADPPGIFASVGMPAMAGDYSVRSNLLRFEPRFPIDRGITYRAVFSPMQLRGTLDGRLITSTFRLPKLAAMPGTVVSHVYPTADVVPENLLKFYLHFSAPMSGGHIYDHIHLRDESGKNVELPFLEIDEELWNPAMTRLTLFIDPGRIKRGVQPLEEIGPSLEQGKQYTLVIDAGWRDAANLPLKEGFQKRFRVGATDRSAIDTSLWRIEAPASATRGPLRLAFPEPMDHALALRVIRVLNASGQLVEGKPALEDQERRWSFIPAHEWTRGNHAVSVQTTIEDLAGNNIGKSFEVDLFEGVQRRFTNTTVKLPFAIH